MAFVCNSLLYGEFFLDKDRINHNGMCDFITVVAEIYDVIMFLIKRFNSLIWIREESRARVFCRTETSRQLKFKRLL